MRSSSIISSLLHQRLQHGRPGLAQVLATGLQTPCERLCGAATVCCGASSELKREAFTSCGPLGGLQPAGSTACPAQSLVSSAHIPDTHAACCAASLRPRSHGKPMLAERPLCWTRLAVLPDLNEAACRGRPGWGPGLAVDGCTYFGPQGKC